jgi:mono/diheme cytochrome c family protein
MKAHRAGIACVAALWLLFGCEKVVRNMYEQPKYKPLDAAALWADGQSARPLEAGVVVRSAGAIAAASSGRLGEQPLDAAAQPVYPRDERGALRADPSLQAVVAEPKVEAAPVTLGTLRRGRERYDIYCAPCHSVSGDGDGMVVRRGFPAPRTLHSDRLRSAPDSYLYGVISEGYGVMYPFADRITPRDRWAIVAYIRALQLSQHARIDDVPADERGALLGEAK